MPLAKCPRSGKLFDNAENPVHPEVLDEEEADYEKIFEYVEANSGCSPEQVIHATGVDKGCLERLIAQGRLAQFTLAELHAYEEKKREKSEEAAKRQAEIAQKLQGVKLPPKKKVQVGGTAHSTFEEKRRGS